MAVDLDLLNANSIANINTNFTRVQAAFEDSVSRSGNLPNHLTADIDMNSNDILNGGRIDFQEIYLDGVPIVDFPAFEEVAAIAAEVIAVAAIAPQVVIVANNITDINIVVDNIIDIQNAEENADAAVTSAAAALVSENNAEASSELAEKWATEAEDVPVTVGPNLYSAFHWAQKSAASAATAASNIVGAILGFATKATPADADIFGFVQDSDSTGRKLTWANIKTVLFGIFPRYDAAAALTIAQRKQFTLNAGVGEELIGSVVLGAPAASLTIPNLDGYSSIRYEGVVVPVTSGGSILGRLSADNGVTPLAPASGYVGELLTASGGGAGGVQLNTNFFLAAGNAAILNSRVRIRGDVGDWNKALLKWIHSESGFTNSAGTSQHVEHAEVLTNHATLTVAMNALVFSSNVGNLAAGSYVNVYGRQ